MKSLELGGLPLVEVLQKNEKNERSISQIDSLAV